MLEMLTLLRLACEGEYEDEVSVDFVIVYSMLKTAEIDRAW